METHTAEEIATCQVCFSEMKIIEPEIKDLDINNLSLLSMFNIHKFYIVECPACKKSGLQIS